MIALVISAATGAFNRFGPALVLYAVISLGACGLLAYAHHAGAVSAERASQIQELKRDLAAETLRADTIASDKANVERAFNDFVLASEADSKKHRSVTCAIQAAPDRARLAPSTIARLRAIRGER